MYTHTADFLERLQGVQSSKNGWEARCPCRQDDRNPSLSIHENEDGRILLHCHRNSGCTTPDIVACLGKNLQDLWPKETETTHVDYPTKPKTKLKFVTAYRYENAERKLLFEKVRYIDPDTGAKTFRQRRPDGKGGWMYSLGDTPAVLYHLPEVLAAAAKGETVFVVEGEKDADALRESGATATTAPGGAGKWLPIHTEALTGAIVDVIVDNDEPGQRHGRVVSQALQEAGIDVQVWRCPDGHKDIYDFLAAGGDTTGLLSVPFADLADAAEVELVIEVEEDPQVDEQVSVEQQVLDRIAELLASDKPVAQVLAKVADLAASAHIPSMVDVGRLVDWSDFVDEEVNDAYEWLIPGLIEKQERVMVVAAEGVGKTMLARQIAICSGYGVNPFTHQRMKRIRTLTVDLENPERIIRRTSTSIVGAARSMGFERKGDVHLVIKPDGINLLSVADRLMLEAHIEKVEPELLVLGPIYKSFLDPGNKTSEAVAIEVARYLDRLRITYNVALWLEHHAPLGASMTSRELRPFGSAVWSRWPEFGLALSQDPTVFSHMQYDVNHFRGARDLRSWPKTMKRGSKFPFEVIEYTKVI